MRVLFVSSGTNSFGISPIVKNQGESLKEQGIELEYFTIKQKGLKGYFKAIFELKELLKSSSFDVIHAHYWLSALVASFAGAKPIVASLMGDDVKTYRVIRWIIYLMSYISWSKIIVKSKDMYNSLGLKGVSIVPNGVDMNRFKSIPKEIAQRELGWDSSKRHILFTSDPNRYEKNFSLLKKAVDILNNNSIEIHYLKDIPNERVFYYYNAADVVALSSLWEGSPNAVKESMACSVPIVSTNVGDVQEVLSDTKGCYIASFEPEDFASKLKEAMEFGKKTEGREKIDYLKSQNIAKKIINIYKEAIKGK